MRKFKTKFLAMVLAISCIAGASVTASAATQATLTMDTKSYSMAPGNIYDFKAVVTGGDLKQADVKVSDSRNGSVVKLSNLGNGKYRITALKEGTTYVVAEIAGAHASIQVNVKKGIKQSGVAARSVTVIGDYNNGIKTYNQGDKVIISNSSSKELYSISIDSIQLLDGRNNYENNSISQVVAIKYTYTNIDNGEPLVIYDSQFNVIDEKGFVSNSYMPSIDMMMYDIDDYEHPQKISKGTSCTAVMVMGLKNNSNSITIQLKDGLFTNNDPICQFVVKI